jgi:prepilin-type N-terminal cleavage/methylation domain-containing protein
MNKSKNNRVSTAGFTLIETLVVVAITLILSGLAVTYSRSGERQVVLYKDQAVVVGVINQAKSFAAQKYRDPGIAGDYEFCAFGVHFESGSRDFVLFQDLGAGTCVYDPNNANYRYDAGADPSEAISTHSLDSRLEFGNLPDGSLDVFFIPPDITASSSTDLPVSITIKTIDGELEVVTTFAPGGQIITE